MTDPTIPTAPTAPGGPAALEIANMLAAGKIDTTQAGKLARAGNISSLQVAQALHGSREAAPRAPIVQGPQTDLSEAQAAKIVEWTREDLTSGKITEAQATSIFNDLGTPMAQRIITEDTRSDEQRMLDHHFPPAKESEFLLHMYPPGQAPAVIPKEIQAFEANIRGWMADAGLSREQGNSVVTIISKMLQHTHAMTAEQRKTYEDQEDAKLRTLFGGQDKLNEALEPARQMIHEVEQKRPGLKEFVRAHGNNALFIAQLVQAARIYHARRKGR